MLFRNDFKPLIKTQSWQLKQQTLPLRNSGAGTAVLTAAPRVSPPTPKQPSGRLPTPLPSPKSTPKGNAEGTNGCKAVCVLRSAKLSLDEHHILQEGKPFLNNRLCLSDRESQDAARALGRNPHGARSSRARGGGPASGLTERSRPSSRRRSRRGRPAYTRRPRGPSAAPTSPAGSRGTNNAPLLSPQRRTAQPALMQPRAQA